MEYMLGKGDAASLVRVSSYILSPFKSRQNELCNVLNTPTVLQLSWQSGFCRRHDVFTSFCEIKCQRSGVSGTNDKVHSDVQNSNRDYVRPYDIAMQNRWD